MGACQDATTVVKALALESGFARVGIASAGPVGHFQEFLDWLALGHHADMAYLACNIALRQRPDLLVPGARSVICLAAGYAPAGPVRAGRGFVARFARGRDYHKLLKRRCEDLMGRLAAVAPAFAGRAFVDSAPVMERSLAAAAGLGWVGRNGCLIVPGMGSYVLLCEIVCNLPLAMDRPLEAACGDCRACLSACPTGALLGEGLLDARRCVSYLTVENRGPIEPESREAVGERLFGCDTCQEACPHNRQPPPGDPELTGLRPPQPAEPTVEDVLGWDAARWDAATRGYTRRRASFAMWMRNAILVAGNGGDASLCPLLRDVARREPAQQGMVEWALWRLAGGQAETSHPS